MTNKQENPKIPLTCTCSFLLSVLVQCAVQSGTRALVSIETLRTLCTAVPRAALIIHQDFTKTARW